MTSPIPENELAGEVLWGIENAKLLSTEKKLEFLKAIKEGRFEEIREELTRAMEAEVYRIDGDIEALNRQACAFLKRELREIRSYGRKPFLQRLFVWAMR